VVVSDKPADGGAASSADNSAVGSLRSDFSHPARTWRVWSMGFGDQSSLKDTTSAGLDFSQQTYGGTLGADYQVNPNLLTGFAVGGSSSTFSLPDSSTSGQLEAADVGAYADAQFGSLYLLSGLSFSHFNNFTTRTVTNVGPTETDAGRFASEQVGGQIELGWRQAFGDFSITPFGSLGFFDTFQNQYSESADGGSGLYALTFTAHDAVSAPVSLGAQFDIQKSFEGGWTWSLFGRGAWEHETQPIRQINAYLDVLPSAQFTVDGITAAANVADVKLGSQLKYGSVLSLFATAEGKLSRDEREYTIMAGLSFVPDGAKGTEANTAPVGNSAPAWVVAATSQLHYDSWSSTRGFPSSSTSSPGSGMQAYWQNILQAAGTPIQDLKVDLAASAGAIYSRQSTPGLDGSVGTPTDTVASGTFTYTGIPGMQPFFSLNVNVPTGRSALLGSAANSRMDPDFVDVGTFGEGLNVGPSLGVLFPFDSQWTASVSGGYTHHGPYEREGLVDPTTFSQGLANFAPGQDFTATASASYLAAPFSTQVSASFMRETATFYNGAPSYQLGDRYLLTGSETYAWSDTTKTSLTGTVTYNTRNNILNPNIPAFLAESFDSNSFVARLRLDHSFVIDKLTFDPFGTLLDRNRNSYDPSAQQFVPAKILYSGGASIKYAVTDKVGLTASVEHFWSTEQAEPAYDVPVNHSQGWKTILAGSALF
jgi:hypothetical protein